MSKEILLNPDMLYNWDFKVDARGYRLQEVDKFLALNKTYLEKKGFNIYFTGARFFYENANRIVQPNELMIAIKEDKE